MQKKEARGLGGWGVGGGVKRQIQTGVNRCLRSLIFC